MRESPKWAVDFTCKLLIYLCQFFIPPRPLIWIRPRNTSQNKHVNLDLKKKKSSYYSRAIKVTLGNLGCKIQGCVLVVWFGMAVVDTCSNQGQIRKVPGAISTVVQHAGDTRGYAGGWFSLSLFGQLRYAPVGQLGEGWVLLKCLKDGERQWSRWTWI